MWRASLQTVTKSPGKRRGSRDLCLQAATPVLSPSTAAPRCPRAGSVSPCSRCPRPPLLGQRDVAVFLETDFEGLLDQLIALGRIRLDQHLVGEGIQLLVAVPAEIGFAAVGVLFVAPAAHDVVQNVLRIR